MKVECKTCGQKFKGTHGVAVHARKMHHVDSISGAAEVVVKPKKEKVRLTSFRLDPKERALLDNFDGEQSKNNNLKGHILTVRAAMRSVGAELQIALEAVGRLESFIGMQ